MGAAVCQACGQPLRERRFGVVLTPLKAAIVDAIKRAGDLGVSSEGLIWALYLDRNPVGKGTIKAQLQAISDVPVKEWVENDAVLFLWVTSPILAEAFQIVTAWGFEYKASFVWDKIKHNMGHYNSVRHELLLICTRGSCQPDKQQLFDSVQSIERGKLSSSTTS
jgi:hypothetical protein